jgi:4-hydroxy-tetrahydrodipicolinate reductase
MGAPRRVLVVGACGRMGQCVRSALAGEPSLRLAAALEAPGHPRLGEEIAPGVKLQGNLEAALAGCDVAIDFSQAAVSLAVLRAAAEAGVGIVMGTTGLSADQRAELARAARRIPVLHAPNFSVSVNVLVWLVREAARRLGPGYDAEILELHHAKKLDAPSGTALLLAEAIAEGRGHPLEGHLVLERAGQTGAGTRGTATACSTAPPTPARDRPARSASSPCAPATAPATTACSLQRRASASSWCTARRPATTSRAGPCGRRPGSRDGRPASTASSRCWASTASRWEAPAATRPARDSGRPSSHPSTSPGSPSSGSGSDC